MNKINFIPSYSNRVFCGNRNILQTQDKQGIATHINNECLTSEASSASRAYALSFINKNKTIPQMSLKNLIRWLEMQGKVEGKDYEIDSSCTLGNTVVVLKNKLGQEELLVHYDNRNHDSWSGYDLIEYQNGKVSKQTFRDENNDISVIAQMYSSEDESIQHLIKDNIAYGTKPEILLKSLVNQNLACGVEYCEEDGDSRYVLINVYDENGNVSECYNFYYGANEFNEQYHSMSKSEYNKQGQTTRRLLFNKESVDVITYVGNL